MSSVTAKCLKERPFDQGNHQSLYKTPLLTIIPKEIWACEQTMEELLIWSSVDPTDRGSVSKLAADFAKVHRSTEGAGSF